MIVGDSDARKDYDSRRRDASCTNTAIHTRACRVRRRDGLRRSRGPRLAGKGASGPGHPGPDAASRRRIQDLQYNEERGAVPGHPRDHTLREGFREGRAR